MICAGIDAGSRSVKMMLLDRDTGNIIARGIEDQGIQQEMVAEELFDRLLGIAMAGRDDVVRCIATGYARNAIEFADDTITEITCHARGVHHLHPDARTVIEIGGQDSKLLRLNEDGSVYDFAMNDRCAAGTGRFLEIVAQRLDMHVSELGTLVSDSSDPAVISSMCIVFAETEIIGLLAAGTPPADIVAGIERAIATRVVTMVGRKIQTPVVFTGGVALIPGMKTALETVLNRPVKVAESPQYTGALGATLLAAEQ
jgi:predicted CoA-substrate-specific enzyme activase